MFREAFQELSRVTTNETFTDWQRDFVGPLYRKARGALGDPQKMTVVQLDLMDHIYALQETRKDQDKERRRALRESGDAGRQGDAALAQKLARDARYHETVRNAATFTIRQLREIGDMLAWKTLRNRMAIRLMASKSPPGDLPPRDDYLATVRDAASESDKLRSYPLLTDVTNLLRHGDVLYIPWDGSRIVRVEELKGRSGGDPRRHARQLRSLIDLDRLLNQGNGMFDGKLLHLRRCTLRLTHHFDVLRETIAAARAGGYAAARVSRNHAIEVLDFTDLDRVERVIEQARAGPGDEALVGARPDDRTFDVGLWPRIEDVMLPAAPWGVYPLPEQDRLDLASLRLWHRSILNVDGLLRDSAAAGAPGELVIEPAAKYMGLRIKMPRVTHEMEASLFTVRVGLEFLDEGVVLELLRRPAWPPPPEGSSMMFEFRDEMTLWD
ncbi:MAG: hypothetical protein KGK34_02125 [Chloroflexota bacterium]|nr:hypothetical protein [Chloroflexota bacterium]